MSGFIAVIQFDRTAVDPGVIDHIMNRLTYRGTDKQTIYHAQNVAFGHTLFRTTFEDRNDEQPLTIDCVTIVGDVRLDARQELVDRLRHSQLEISSNLPDSELVLKAYLAWGERFTEYLCGDYTFVLWDARKECLLAGRDRLGLRKLYYAYLNRVPASEGPILVLSNDLGAIRLHPNVTEKLNDQAIGDFLLSGNNLWKDKTSTSFNDIKRVPPAHLLYADRGRCETRRYWQLPTNQPMLRYRREQDYIEHFRSIFKMAIRDRVRTDCVVLSLSGGMDSSSIAATLCEMIKVGEVNTEIKTITGVYDRILPDTEAYYVGLIARQLNLPTHFVTADEFSYGNPPAALSEPTQSAFQIDYYEKYGRETAFLGRTVIEGSGGDELFLPTPLFDALRRHSPLASMKLYFWLWRFMKRRPLLEGMLPSLNPLKWHSSQSAGDNNYPVWLNPDFEQRLNLKTRWKEFENYWNDSLIQEMHPRNNLAYYWLKSLNWERHMEFVNVPNFGQYSNLAPFLDLRLIDFMLSLPPVPWFKRKYLLRQAMIGRLPEEVLRRSKTPLGYTMKTFLDRSEMDWINRWLPADQLPSYIDRAAIPPLNGPGADFSEAYMNIRPFLLNGWLSTALS